MAKKILDITRKQYMKSNKVRRQYLVERNGYKTEASMLRYADFKPETTTATTSTSTSKRTSSKSKKTIHIVHILDRSSSMSGTRMRTAVRGIQNEIQELRKNSKDVNYLLTLVGFSYKTNYRVEIDKQRIESVNENNISTRASGMTALNQSVGKTLELFQKETNNVLIKVFTDGGENASYGKYKNPSVLGEFISELENRGNFTITFVGTKREVEYAQSKMGVSASNTLTHDNTADGIEAFFLMSTTATTEYSKSVSLGKSVTKGFYKDFKK